MKVFSVVLACFLSLVTFACIFGAIWTTGAYYPERLAGTAFFMFWTSVLAWAFAAMENND